MTEKKYKSGLALGALYLLFLGGLMQGQENKGAATLDLNLQKAVEIALSDNLTIKIAEKEIQRVNYSAKEARSALFPSLTAEGSYNRNFNKPVIFMPDGIFGPGTGGPIEMGYDNSFTGSIAASMPLFSYSLLQSIKITEHDLELAMESARLSKVNMVAEVKKAYYTLLLAYNSYEVMSKSIENANDNLRNVQNLYSQGVVAEYDVIRSDVQVRNLKPSLTQAQNAVSMSEMLVRILLGLHQDVKISVTDALADYNSEGLMTVVATGFDISNNSELRQLDLQLERMQTQFQLIRSQRYPTLVLFGQYQFTSQANDFRFSQYQWAKPFIGGVTLQIPIFRGFALGYQEKNLRIGQEQMAWQREYMDRSLAMQMQNAYTNMQRAIEQIESSKVGVSQAERGFSIARTRYQTGSGTLLELNDAEIALTQAKLNLNQAMFDYLSSEADFYRIQGQGM
jgi:outer membrane protein